MNKLVGIVIAIWEIIILVDCTVATRLLYADQAESLDVLSSLFGWMHWVTETSVTPVHSLLGDWTLVAWPDKEAMLLDWSPAVVVLVLEMIRQRIMDD